MAIQTSDKLNVDKLMEVLSDILSKKYGCKVTMKAIPKDSVQEKPKEEQQTKVG